VAGGTGPVSAERARWVPWMERPARFGWPRWVIGSAQAASRVRDRRPSGWELLIVLAVFPAGGALTAVGELARRAVGAPGGGGYLPVVLADHPLLAAALDVPTTLLAFAPAFLVGYLLAQSGGGLRAIGLDLDSLRADLGRTGKLMLLAYLLPFFLAAGLLDQAGVTATVPPVSGSLLFLLPLLIAAVSAGVVEEIVVLGYLVHRLEQRGWSGWRLAAVATAVRGSFHLYYGFTVLGFLGWAAISVILYRRRRRLLSFIVLHALWDAQGFTIGYLHGGYRALPFLALSIILVGLFLAEHRNTDSESQRPPPDTS